MNEMRWCALFVGLGLITAYMTVELTRESVRGLERSVNSMAMQVNELKHTIREMER